MYMRDFSIMARSSGLSSAHWSARDAACPISTGRGARRVRSVRRTGGGGGRGVVVRPLVGHSAGGKGQGSSAVSARPLAGRWSNQTAGPRPEMYIKKYKYYKTRGT